MSYHLAIGMSKPVHHDPLRDRVVGASATEVVTEAVKPAILKTALSGKAFREHGCERLDDFANENVPNGIRL